jgi:transcriptional regulator with XRE-family HTH domain
MNLQELKKKALENQEVKNAYDDLDVEFKLINQLIHMRKAAGLTQEEVANRMATKKSNICRLEKFGAQPKISTIQKYAKACGYVFGFDFKHL